MAFTWEIKPAGRSGTEGLTQVGEVVYVGKSDDPSTDTEVDARVSLYAFAPSTRGTQVIVDAQAEEMEADGYWLGTVRYGPPTFILDTGQTRQTFTTAGGTQRIFRALTHLTTWDAASGNTIINSEFDGTIGPRSDGDPEGVDVIMPIWEESRTFVFENSDITSTFKGILFRMTARQNDDTFFYFNTGECLLRGVDGGQRQDGKWELTFHLAGSPNASSLSIPGTSVTITLKLGWDNLSCLYTTKDDSTLKTVATKIKAVFLDRIYNTGDFSTLGIGTS